MSRAGVRQMPPGHSLRSALLKGTSLAVLATMLAAAPAHAQLASMRSALGVPANLGTQAQTPVNTVTAVTPTMNQILARHNAYEARIQQAAGMIAQANAAARAAAAEAAKTVPDGLVAGGLDPVAITLTSAQDPTGLAVWEGATKPTQSQSGSAVDVTIDQTQSRALLSWNSFNIGANTTLTFDQQGNSNWVVVNRVVGAIDPATGLIDPSKDISPTQILGTIKADGSVYILDRAGVMFGATSQVNLHSLLASSLELGSATVPASSTTLRNVSLQERNDSFLTRGLLTDTVSGLVSAVAGEQHGDVSLAAGAQINATGGYVILAAPNVSSAGEINNTPGGQVSLEAGTQVDATTSSGAADSADPFVRGLILSSLGGGDVSLTGSIDAPEGYISLGTDLTGTVNMDGFLSSTTSVSRNGKISLIGGTVNIGDGAAMTIAPDTSGATIPQSSDSISAFKASQIDIGSRNYTTEAGRITPASGGLTFDLLPADITIGANSTIVAPSANVSIGGRLGDVVQTIDELPTIDAKVDIQDNAVIDVSGVPDVLLDPSRNVLEISPAKGNELRDTPNYRNPTTDGSFTLNGQTLFVDPRLSGVRADGVAWIGSPLIEAGSLAAQIGITAPELMTTGGNVNLATLGFKPSQAPAPGTYIPSINIASNAIVDFSGGWVRYSAGSVHYTKLLTADGRVVDISQADPNDDFVAVSDGYAEQLPQLANPTIYANTVLQGTTYDPGYVEGHDAGSLTIQSPTGNLNGQFHGDAVAGTKQIGAGEAATRVSTLPGDIRLLQANANQLPSAGLLHIESIPGADIVIGKGSGDGSVGTIALDADGLNAAHLGALSLQTSGKVTLDASADVNLAPGGAFNADAGRTITFNGDISAPDGSISARTYGVLSGNIFDPSDDLPPDGVLTSDDPQRMFDIVVNDGSVLSVRGRWTNDSLVADPLLYEGPGYTSGGTISLTSAPHVEAFKADGSGAVDLSGSILLKPGSLLDASGGGYVSPSGTFSLDGKGGDVSLINQTNYFESEAIVTVQGRVPSGTDLFRSDLSSFQVTPDANHSPAVVPDAVNATVELDGDIRSFGFKGGGTFSLVTPDLKFGSSDGSGTEIPLDFLDRTGFKTLSLSAWNTAIIDNVFGNGIVGKTGLLATDIVQIQAGETLNLTQSILPSILTTDQANLLASQTSGSDISRLAAIAPTNQLSDWDNLPANLILGGLTELQNFGTITGAPQASIEAPRVYNAGTIRIAGGSLIQQLTLPASYVAGPGTRAAIGVHPILGPDGTDNGAGLAAVFGTPDASGHFDENAPNALGLSLNGNVISNRDLVGLAGSDRQIYYLGLLDADQGIVLAPNSVTDLSGTSIRNPRASLFPGSTNQIATGRLVDGGTIAAASLFYSSTGLFSAPGFGERPYSFFDANGVFNPNSSTPALQIVAGQGAAINLSGASDTFDIETGANTFTPTAVWSNAGRLSALGGGDVTGATIDAHGGAPEAQGGTLEWLDPTLVQAASGQAGVVSADQIESAGFDLFIGRGDVTTQGNVDLTLGRGFILTARNYSGAPLTTAHSTVGDTLPYADPYYAISFGASGDLSISAPHIALLGIDQTVSSLSDPLETGGSLALHGGSIDIFGAVAFRDSLSSVLLDSQGDIRLIGVQPLAKTLTPTIALDSPSLSGQVIAAGDLTFHAAQVYATTGSGNLQALTESGDSATVRPFVIGSTGADATVRFESNGSTTPPVPYSAGSYLSIVGANIDQAGVLRAPLGRIDLGSGSSFQQGTATGPITIGATQNVTLEPGSITSVSLGGLKVPYGTTTDLTDYFFAPGSSAPLSGPPAAELRFGGANISVLGNATVDASGGSGDIYAYEFVSGTGGSRDVLSRYNSDAFSSNNGFQYPDGRQVYAILPVGSAQTALYDPIYSAGYGSLYSSDAGKIVHLDGGNGVPAGDYILLPGQYAMLPGAMRLVENVGVPAPLPGQSAELRDGSVIVAGTYGTAGTNQTDWQRLSFTVQSQAVFSKYSKIVLTSGTTRFTDLASGNGTAVPRLPADAARLVFSPSLSLITNGNFDTDPAAGGRGSEVDIAADVIDVVSQETAPTNGVLTLVAGDLEALNAASLFLGGIRTDLSDGSTNLKITAHEINILNDAAHALSAPEILLAVDGIGSTLNLADGASIVATGELADTRTGDYNVASYTLDSGGNIVADNTGAGAVFRLANGPERLVNRSGALADSVTTKPVTYTIGKVNLAGNALTLDTSRQLRFNAASALDVHHIAISGDDISFSSRTYGIAGLVITPELEQAFSVADSLTIRANNAIGFTAGVHNFNDLTLLAPGIRVIRTQRDGTKNPLLVTLNAADVVLGNRSADAGACRGNGAFSCGTTGNSLVLNATALTFSGGTFHTYGFDRSVALNAANGMDYTGVGAFDVGNADLSLGTPFIADLGTGTQPTNGATSQADLELRTTGNVSISAGATSGTPGSVLAPGARLAIGSLSAPTKSISIDGSLLRASAGTIEAYAQGNVAITGAATLATPSYSQQFGDSADPVTVSANGGTISLVTLNGDISLGQAATLSIGGKTGGAGALNLLASDGHIDLSGTIDAAAPNNGASLNYDSGQSAFDLGAFLLSQPAFTGNIAVRTGVGDLALGEGQVLKASSVSLTADGGSTVIGGTIDTSGINGGDIALFARDAVSLLSSAVLDARATGYAESDTRQAVAGNVILGAGSNGSINVANGASIRLDAERPGDRLVPKTQTDPGSLNTITSYTYVQGDEGGTLTLRAPVIGAGGAESVDVTFAGSVTGARDVSVEGYRSYDLSAIAADPSFTGVTVNPGTNVATLDLAASAAGKTNFLAGLAPGTIPDFIQNFDISADRSNLGILPSLAVYHERPGVELDHSGGITLASNWNLGAGTVDIPAAIAAGDMRLSTLGPYADGTPRYEVVPGHEAHLFQNFVDMTYRVGGKVNGEAGVLTLRAGGDLNVAHSITDGFFAFGDQTDPAFINAQLGGGTRTFDPAIGVQCGVGGGNPTTCSNVLPFDPAARPSQQTSINFNLTAIVRGAEVQPGIAPYSEAANSPAALGLGPSGAGDPIGSAQLFPLLGDGSAAGSFSIQLVGGAGPAISANPLHIDRASGGSVVVSGESTYAIQGTHPVGAWGGTGELSYLQPGSNDQFISSDFLASLATLTGLDQTTLTNATAHVRFGQVLPAATDFMRQAALQFFAAYPGQVHYLGSSTSPTGFEAPVGLVIQFLQSTDAAGVSLIDRFAEMINDGTLGYRPPQPNGTIGPPGAIARVHTLVRTGTGSIDVAAARNIDLTNGPAHLLSENAQNALAIASNAAQEGGSAIYTAGRLIAPTIVAARVAGTQDMLAIDPSNYAITADARNPLWVPTSTGRLQDNPVYATGGGSISLVAGEDVLGRRDVWSEAFNSNNPAAITRNGIDHSPTGSNIAGSSDQRWRVGSIGLDSSGNPELATNIRINPQLYSSGIGTLGGGNVSIDAGHDVSELTVALDTSVTTGDVGSSFGSMVFGGGNLSLHAGHDILGGRFDISSGVAQLSAGRDIDSSGQLIVLPQPSVLPASLRVDNLPEIRLTDAQVNVTAGGSVRIGQISALGTDSGDAPGIVDHLIDQNALGYYTGQSGVSIQASGDVSLAGQPTSFVRLYALNSGTYPGSIMPASLEVTSFGGDINLGKDPLLMIPGANGQLSLLAGGTVDPATIDLDDGDPSLMPGIFSALNFDTRENLLFAGRPFSLPITLPGTSDLTRRLYHDEQALHENDPNPVRIAVGGDLVDLTLFSAKATRVSAGRDIVNMMFVGQNVNPDDVTRITAARDITATVAGAFSSNSPDFQAILGKSITQGNQFILGGPGSFFVEAGRNLGPFLPSSTIVDTRTGQPVQEDIPGGILAVGNDYNPWLPAKSADVYAFFGVGKGMDFDALRETYVNPANAGQLDDALFEQITDPFGNKKADRTKPIYSAILVSWMQQNEAGALIAAFGSTGVTASQAYLVFAALPELVQRKFLLEDVYFNELQAPSRPDNVSYLHYVRGYKAVNTLFPASLGYTANDLSGNHNGGTRVETGNLDLRLATIQTTRGGDITILGPGGDAILGSVVRTSTQAQNRAYQPSILDGFDQNAADFRPTPTGASYTVPVESIPIGYEGVLTLRGGNIFGFTDGDFRLNQSRLFTEQSGDITLWSSNGDLNAGQGPKSAANVPPIVVRFDPNAFSEVDSAGAVTGAGIAGFTGISRLDPATGQYVLVDSFRDSDLLEAQQKLAGLPPGSTIQVNGKNYRKDAPTITLVAPVGTVDAGDAGVRAGGDVFVAAARVANADNFKVGGQSIGVPAAAPTAPPTPANAASAITANIFRATNPNGAGEQRVRIVVDVLGYYGTGDEKCPPDSSDPKCKNN